MTPLERGLYKFVILLQRQHDRLRDRLAQLEARIVEMERRITELEKRVSELENGNE